MRSFHNKVAAITGAASGMGRQLAIQLAGCGCHLALSDVSEAALAETQALARRANTAIRISIRRVDVADREAVFAWAKATALEHGKVNLVFNNAGVAMSGTAEATKIEDFTWLMNINFWGVVHGTQAFLPHLRASGDGHIINTSSLFGLLSTPATSAYHAAKFAVRGYTESLRQELDMMKCGVSATCVHPGGIKTAIAQNARTDESVKALGIDPRTSKENFSRYLVTSAEQAAATILNAVRHDKRRVLVGRDAIVLDKVQRLFPAAYMVLIGMLLRRTYKR
jgi:short-subunit dehydrogenase